MAMSESFPKILIADDEKDILEILEHNLKREEFNVITAENGEQAVDLALKHIPDLIILDVMMPNIDGMEACRRIKADASTQHIPVLFLTARNEEFAEITGFEVGADDYISKPIRPRVLISRIKAVLRRKADNDGQENSELSFGELRINRTQFLVIYKDKEIKLPRKEFELLELLASQPGKVFTRQEILQKVWGNDVFVIDRTIDVHIRKIREKIYDELIQTVKGIGYKFVVN